MSGSLSELDPRALRAHPDQERIYGAVGGDHDPTFADFEAGIAADGVLVPLLVSRGTPGLPDNTIISGHRRWTAASRRGLATVPAIFRAFESALHAAKAHLCTNDQRAKDEWVKTREAERLREIESALAKQRQRDSGGDRTSPTAKTGSGTGTGTGDTRAIVAKHLGESEKTTELRFKLAEKAREQSPANPSASPVAKALQANKPVKTVAREFGIIKPDPVKDRRATVLAIVGRILHAPTRKALAEARGEAETLVPMLTPKEAEEVGAANAEAARRLDAAPPPRPDSRQTEIAASPVALPPLPDVMAPLAGLRWARELASAVDRFVLEWRRALSALPRNDEHARASLESEATRVLDLMLETLPDDARSGVARLAVIRGGK